MESQPKSSPYTESVTISFVDTYTKLKINLIREITSEEMAELSDFIGKTSKGYGLTNCIISGILCN